MPRKPKTIVKPKKQKLSPAERSQIAKDRWVKRRKAKTPEIAGIATNVYYAPTETGVPVQGFVGDTPAPPVVEQEPVVQTGHDENGVPPIVGLGDGTITKNGEFVPDQPPSIPAAPTVEAPAAQLAPVRAPKPKRYQGPKEFSVALKAAEARLAKAIVERAQAAGSLAALNAEIPSLLGIINALKGNGGSYTQPPVPYDYPGVPAFPPAPLQAPLDPNAAIMAAMAAPPVSRAQGGAVQLPPDVVGTLEEDDNEDKFITGPAAGGSGWIGG